MLKQAEDGTPVVEVCRKSGIAEATFYTWRERYEVKRLRQLEEENARPKIGAAHPREIPSGKACGIT